MAQVDAPVLLHRRIAPDHFRVRLKAPSVARRARAGQFIHLRCGGPALLRRPFSLLDADGKRGTIDFIYKVMGLGTKVLSRVPAGRKVDLLGPLGRPFEVPSGLERAYLVGGGVGIPPLVFLAKRLAAEQPSCRVTAFLGARTKDRLICAEMFRRLGVKVRLATDDGTLGYRGSVVDLLTKFLRSDRPDPASTSLYLCGPTPMMAAAAALARRHGLPAQVSLEERMGCAMGVCMGCVVEVAAEPHSSHARFRRVCTEGPVFPAEAIAWR